MKIHIAAGEDLRRKAAHAAALLAASGHEVVSRWLSFSGKPVALADEARFTLNDVVAADCLVLFTESRQAGSKEGGGAERHVELGYALKAGKRICVLGPRETVFCNLPEIERYRTVKELVYGLR